MDEKQVVVNGLLTNYRQYGNGKKVILMLHGWGDSSLTFSSLIPKIIDSNYTIYSIDLPGFGKTETPSETWGLDDYARFTAAFIKKIGFVPYCLVGHSNGGAILIRGIYKSVLECEKLVLLASAGIRGEYKGRLKVIRMITKTGKIAVSPLPKSVKNKLRRRFYDSVGSDMLVAENLQETFKRVVEDDVRENAKKVDVDTMLIYGENDTATPLSFGKILEDNIKNSKLYVINNAGHFVFKDKEDEVVRLIEEFIS